ncbi:TrmH family RNA methyltransferase [Patescibacteria group bacterium]|nr:TrmH family RNA methyltransferase [Patescibacteria group bacterium]MBU4016793.1 TrmH family RNA methyltransferase [Patescibacteria group bacterium]MBU4098810.1 TrmH family RNA methyltransferase [Patescibacteria group bacterium]
MIKLGAAELRKSASTLEEKAQIKKNPVYIILDNVLDTYNVGAIFRLAEAVAAERVYLCGMTETPPNSRIKKASINTTEWVAWSYASTAVEALQEIKTSHFAKASRDKQISNIQVIAVEQDPKSVPYNKVEYSFPIALVVGHETEGVSKEVLDMADQIVEIPMWGVNKSLNVMVSLGIVLFEVMKGVSGIDSRTKKFIMI